ncbi:hypothetical protein HER32_20035 [Hymenobacter sp. BT18]|uniref:hypothetical protein n=1 Tax=Hymenobacter sp. BT18 TaxID=2835648 RepID=UPI00143EA6AE|nr:hypothetical protein [Hymenobacter sp. BT18]QIX63338.1 hypothetical protein HER32_20035 [Hymenobacter sp. BT18]
MKKTDLLAGCLMLLLLTGFSTPKPALRKTKSVTTWKAWADTTTQGRAKWMVVKCEFYPNGELKRKLSLGYEGDTVGLSVYKLNRDSTLQAETWYNKYLKKWMPGSSYIYRRGEKRPFMVKERFDYASYCTYDAQGKEVAHRIVNERKEPIYDYEYQYDASGWLIRSSMFRFFNGERDDEQREIWEYTKNEKGQVIQADVFAVNTLPLGPTVKTDKNGNKKITYSSTGANTKSLLRTEYYNQRKELTKTVEYDLEAKPQFAKTYEYEYYQ